MAQLAKHDEQQTSFFSRFSGYVSTWLDVRLCEGDNQKYRLTQNTTFDDR